MNGKSNDENAFHYLVEDGVDVVRLAVEEYLDNLHATLFLNWDISQKDRKELCIEFLGELYEALDDLVLKHTVRNSKPITREQYQQLFFKEREKND